MTRQRPDFWGLLVKFLGRMRCLFGCFGIEDDDRSADSLISNARPSVNRVDSQDWANHFLIEQTKPIPEGAKFRNPGWLFGPPEQDSFMSENLFAPLPSCKELQRTSWEHLPKEQTVMFKDGAANCSQSACNNFCGNKDDMDIVLMYESAFLNYCGTLLKTPAEIQKASKKMEVSPDDGDDKAFKFHSWFPSRSCERLHSVEQLPEQDPISAGKFHEVPRIQPTSENSDSLELNPSSLHVFQSPTSEVLKQNQRNCIQSPKSSGFASPETVMELPTHSNDSDTSLNSELPAATTQCKKAVQFEGIIAVNPDDGLLPLSSSLTLSETWLAGTHEGGPLLRPQSSPYPTPLKLTDEMQTPGTVYPAKLATVAIGKNAHIRSQYIYPVPTPIENSYHLEGFSGRGIGLELQLDACMKSKSADADSDGSVEAHYSDSSSETEAEANSG